MNLKVLLPGSYERTLLTPTKLYLLKDHIKGCNERDRELIIDDLITLALEVSEAGYDRKSLLNEIKKARSDLHWASSQVENALDDCDSLLDTIADQI